MLEYQQSKLLIVGGTVSDVEHWDSFIEECIPVVITCDEDFNGLPGIFKDYNKIIIITTNSFVTIAPEIVILNHIFGACLVYDYVASGVVGNKPFFMFDRVKLDLSKRDGFTFDPSLIKNELVKKWHILSNPNHFYKLCRVYGVNPKSIDRNTCIEELSEKLAEEFAGKGIFVNYWGYPDVHPIIEE